MHNWKRCAVGVWLVAAVGCGAHEAGKPQTGTEPTSSQPTDGSPQLRKPDLPSDGAVSVDERAVRGAIEDRSLKLSIPIRSEHAGAGSLRVALIGLDGKPSGAETTVQYELGQGADATLNAELALPDDVRAQQDRVRYSVRIHDAKSSALQVTRSLLYVVPPYELRLEGPSKLQANKPASYRVRALDPVSHAAVSAADVSLQLTPKDGPARSLKAQTDEAGSAVFELMVDQPGAYAVAASAEDQSSTLTVKSDVQAQPPGQKLLLTSDKPLYQPGQTLHLRALALQSPDNQPLASTEVVFEVFDGKGNKVLKKRVKTDDYGIASSDFTLANLVNMGSYKLRASVGELAGEKTVEVSRYVLPKFGIVASTDHAWYRPGASVQGSVDARYFFGKPVNDADVQIDGQTLDVGSNVFAQVMGKTDAQGHYSFSLPLPTVLAGLPLQAGNALVNLHVQITDSAGQVVDKSVPLTVAADAVQVSLVPEAGVLVAGMDNRFHLYATDPLGAPIADAEVALEAANRVTGKTDAFGHVELSVHIAPGMTQVQSQVTPSGQPVLSRAFNFDAQSGAAHVLVRTDKSVYKLGEVAHVQLSSTRDTGHVYVDWQNAGQSLDMRTLGLEKGSAHFDMAIDNGLLGENRIDAYVVDDDGNSVRAGRTILVNLEGGLSVQLAQDKPEYKPGETAQLTFSVKNQKGEPAAAALGVQIVDEAVFGLIDAQPGLLRTYFELEDAFAKPTYELHVPAVSFDDLFFNRAQSDKAEERAAAQAMAEAQLSALQGRPMLGASASSWEQTLAAASQLLQAAVSAEQTRLLALYKPAYQSASQSLAAEGCSPNAYVCMGQSYGNLLSQRALAKVQASDFWGNAYVVSLQATYPPQLLALSNGPDELAGTADDLRVTLDGSALGLSTAGTPTPAGAFPIAAAAAGAAPVAPPATTASVGPARPDADSGGQPRVRKSFPETLYVNPALITDGSGKATISVPLADSITSWRVSSLAHARTGLLGGGQAGVKVFQDFFADVSFPAELTRGDEVQFPVVVYNYRSEPQTVRIELEQAPWFTALGSVTPSLDLGPNEVRSVRVPLRIERAGQQTLTVRAIGSSASDAVQRSVRVVPDGTPVPVAQSGALGNGSARLTRSFPSTAVEGSQQLYLDVYPAFLAQAVQGLDSLLHTPGGCFEQTTSTTWPNVLVSRYLDDTHQTTPEIQLKAESLITAGYQRLLTFEHASGGFSWFGERDGKADISVTAFGVMEFADMSKVHEVDPRVIERTQRWLADQQQADGSWQGGQTEFFSFQTSATRNSAFVLWALAASGYQGAQLARGLDYLAAHLTDADAYTLALAANAFAASDPEDARLSEIFARLDKLKKVQDTQTSWDIGDGETNFYGRGQDAGVTTTALVAHALLTAGDASGTSRGAIEFLTHAKDPQGNFGSTQATIWALKTLLLAAAHGSDGAVGVLDVKLDGQAVKQLTLQKDGWDVTTRIDMSQLATTGDHTLDLAFNGSGQLSYSFVSTHHVPWTTPAASGPLAIAVSYDRASLAVNDTVAATVQITNRTANAQNMLLVSVGIPPGFELLTDALDNQVASGVLSRYEHTGKQLILYVTALPARGQLTINYPLQASMPVRAADGGAAVYLYYQPDQRAQAASTVLSVGG